MGETRKPEPEEANDSDDSTSLPAAESSEIQVISAQIDEALELAESCRNSLPDSEEGTPSDRPEKTSVDLIREACAYVDKMSEAQFDQLLQIFVNAIIGPKDNDELFEITELFFEQLDGIYNVASHFDNYQKTFMGILQTLHSKILSPKEPLYEDGRTEQWIGECRKKFGALFTRYYYADGDKYRMHSLQSCFYDADVAFYINFIDSSLAQDYAEQFVQTIDAWRAMKEPFRYLGVFFHSSMLGALAGSRNPEIDEALQKFLGEYGLDWQKLCRSWSSTDKEFGRSEHIAGNLMAIEMLEKQRPGACKVLNEQFGIEFFGRYPGPLLVRQYDQRDTDAPYGIVLFPKTDWNGAFYGTSATLWDFADPELMQQYQTRIIETSGRFGIALHLTRLDKRYGEKNKISFAIVGGHGKPFAIEFGAMRTRDFSKKRYRRDYKNDHQLSISDLMGRASDRAKSYFTDRPVIILCSCDTGQAGGIGEQISRLYEANLIAPDRPTNFKTIRPRVEGGRIEFDVEYLEEGAARQYIAGQEGEKR